MSIKLKIAMGFVLILIMVFVQSWLFISLNQRKDLLSQEILVLSQLNTTLKDKVIEAKSVQSDALQIIVNKKPFLHEKQQQPLYTCVSYAKSLREWHAAFISSRDFLILDEPRKQAIYDIGTYISNFKESLDKLREIPADNVSARMDEYSKGVFTTFNKFFNSVKDFIGLNSLFFSSQNQSMLAYSERILYWQIFIIALAISLIIFIIFYVQHLLNPLNWLMSGVKHIASGDWTYSVKKRNNDELGKLADQFNLMTSEIQNHREHLEDLVEKRTAQLVEAKNELESIFYNSI